MAVARILLGEGQSVGGAEHLVPDGERGVPHGVEERLGEGLGPLRVDKPRVHDDHDVGVAAERDGAPAEAAHRRERESLRGKGHAQGRLPEALHGARLEERRVGPPQGHAVVPGS